MINKKFAQFSLEFIILLSFLFLVFVGFMAVASNTLLEVSEEDREDTVIQIADIIESEIAIAQSVASGYTRVFLIPPTIAGVEYNISVVEGLEVNISFLDKQYLYFLPENVYGTLRPGYNKVTRLANGTIVLEALIITECNDGIDNDLDGSIDLADAGCPIENDDDESNCGDLVCEGAETCNACVADCGVCLHILRFENPVETVASFQVDGDLVLLGELSTGSPPITGADDEVIIQMSGGDPEAVLNLRNGNLQLAGQLFQNQGFLNPSTSEDDVLIVDDSDVLQAYFDENGNLYISGQIEEFGRP